MAKWVAHAGATRGSRTLGALFEQAGLGKQDRMVAVSHVQAGL